MKKIFGMSIAVAMAISLVACGGGAPSNNSKSIEKAESVSKSVSTETTSSSKESSSTEEKNSSDITIAYSAGDLNLAFDNLLYQAAETRCKEIGVKFVGQDAQADNMLQLDQINALISQGVDGIVVNSVTTDTASAISKACADAGVPLVYCNMFPWGDAIEENIPEGSYYVGSVEEDAGILQAEHALKELGDEEFNYMILEGVLGSSGALGRTNGNHSILDNAPNANQLDEQTGDWLRDEAYDMTQNWLTAHGDKIDVIFANNDEMALGAAKACKEVNRDDILIYGVDATSDGLNAVKDGSLTATVLQDAVKQAGTSVDVVYQLITTGEAETVTWIPFVLITPDDVDEYLK